MMMKASYADTVKKTIGADWCVSIVQRNILVTIPSVQQIISCYENRIAKISSLLFNLSG